MRAEHTPIKNSSPKGRDSGETGNSSPRSLKEVLNSCAAPVMILGIGNSLKGDDGAGPKLCERLKGKIPADVIDAGTVPENYTGEIVKKAPRTLLVIDTVDLGEPAGTVKLLRPEHLRQFALSTHCLSPHLFSQLLYSQIDVQIYILAIQPEQLILGRLLSKPVARAVESIAQEIEQAFAANS
jgi:hydrogenase 3 maturation protease